MTTELIKNIAKRINEIDGRVSAHADGGCIVGTFRGKSREDYKYMISTRSFVFNNEGPSVRKAVESAVSEFNF